MTYNVFGGTLDLAQLNSTLEFQRIYTVSQKIVQPTHSGNFVMSHLNCFLNSLTVGKISTKPFSIYNFVKWFSWKFNNLSISGRISNIG